MNQWVMLVRSFVELTSFAHLLVERVDEQCSLVKLVSHNVCFACQINDDSAHSKFNRATFHDDNDFVVKISWIVTSSLFFLTFVLKRSSENDDIKENWNFVLISQRIMSRTHQNRLRLVSKIERHDFLIDFFCDRCYFINRSCIAMTNSSSRLKCSKCVRLRKVCVNMSWSSLNRNRKEYVFKIVENEKLFAIVITRLLRNKKILKKINVKIKLKTQCLMSKMKKFESLKSFDCFVANVFVDLFFAMWFFITMLNDFSNVDEIVAMSFDNFSNTWMISSVFYCKIFFSFDQMFLISLL